MSASSKKKLRNEQQTAKMTEKQVAEQKEAKKLTLYTTIFVVVLAVMVVFAIAIGVTRSITNSGVHERNTVALTVGDHEISNAELNYFYMSAINNFNSNYGSYAAMLGLDTSKPLNEQVINNDTGLTWADDFLNTAKDNARSAYALADAAEAAGFTLSEDDLADIDSTISNMKLYANLYGYSSTKDFLKAQYGNGATEESYRQYVTLNALASAYRNSYSSSLTYTDADLRAAESENYEKYSSFTYNTYYLAASKFQTDEVDADSDEAVKAAKEAADSLIGEDVATVEDFDAAIAALDVNRDTEASSTAYTDQQYSSVSATIRDWVIDSARKEGDKTVIANTSTSTDDDGKETTTTQGYYAVFFTGSNDNTFPLVNVRHILIKFEGGTTDSTTGTTTYSDEEKEAAKQKAEETGAPAGAMVLPDGRVVTGKTSSLLGASAALLLNALKAMAGIRSDMNLISNQVIEPISALKLQSLGHHNPRLHSDEVLIALAISALTNPLADMARAQLGTLRGCDAHFSVIISEEDIKLYKRLGIHVSCEPKYESKRLYHK